MQVLCLFFGAERKWAANMMSWKSLFFYDNNKKHLIFHHPEKWKEYLSLSMILSTCSSKELFHFATCCNLTLLEDHGTSVLFVSI